MKKHPAKREGLGLSIKTFEGASGKTYLVFKTPKGAFHAFVETEAKDAAKDCGSSGKGNTREQWKSVWQGREISQHSTVRKAPQGQSMLERLRRKEADTLKP